MQIDSCGLDNCFLCTWCTPAWKEAVAVRKKTFRVRKGEAIFNEGDPVKGIFFLNEGSAKIFMKWDDQKDLILRFAVSGDMLGHRGFGGSNRYPISASALEECRLCFIPGDFLDATIATNPGFSSQMIHVYAADLQRAEKRMRDLAHMDVKGRIALALLDIQQTFGTNKNKFIGLPVMRRDIASYAGTTYETVFKLFTEWTKEGILSTDGKNIKINNVTMLKKMVA